MVILLYVNFLLLELGVKAAQSHDYEQAVAFLSKANVPQEMAARKNFYLAVSYYNLHDKRRCLQHLDNIEFLQEVPQRYITVSMLIKSDVLQWKDGDLAEVARDMRDAKNRLSNAFGGPKTQKIQRDIVTKLDKLIKEKEDELRKRQEAAASQQQRTDRAAMPLETPSIQTGEQGDGVVRNKKFIAAVTNWGRMGPAERVKSIQDITQGLSARHREAVENYFRRLNSR